MAGGVCIIEDCVGCPRLTVCKQKKAIDFKTKKRKDDIIKAIILPRRLKAYVECLMGLGKYPFC